MILKLLFEKWWAVALMAPSQYGIAINTLKKDIYDINMVQIIRVLKSALYLQQSNGDDMLSIYTNSYIDNKT